MAVLKKLCQHCRRHGAGSLLMGSSLKASRAMAQTVENVCIRVLLLGSPEQ